MMKIELGELVVVVNERTTRRLPGSARCPALTPTEYKAVSPFPALAIRCVSTSSSSSSSSSTRAGPSGSTPAARRWARGVPRPRSRRRRRLSETERLEDSEFVGCEGRPLRRIVPVVRSFKRGGGGAVSVDRTNFATSYPIYMEGILELREVAAAIRHATGSSTTSSSKSRASKSIKRQSNGIDHLAFHGFTRGALDDLLVICDEWGIEPRTEFDAGTTSAVVVPFDSADLSRHATLLSPGLLKRAAKAGVPVVTLDFLFEVVDALKRVRDVCGRGCRAYAVAGAGAGAEEVGGGGGGGGGGRRYRWSRWCCQPPSWAWR